MEENMRPTTATHDNVFNFEALLHPGTVFEHPKDVVSHPDLLGFPCFSDRLVSRVAGSARIEGTHKH